MQSAFTKKLNVKEFAQTALAYRVTEKKAPSDLEPLGIPCAFCTHSSYFSFYIGISQSRISHWLLQQGSDLSEQKKRAFYRWYQLEKTNPGKYHFFFFLLHLKQDKYSYFIESICWLVFTKAISYFTVVPLCQRKLFNCNNMIPDCTGF